jgi:hypothetical protein
MQTFLIKKDGFKVIKKQMLLRTLPVLIIAAAGGIAIATINSKQKTPDINVLPIIIPFMLVAVGFGLYRGLNRQKALFESYTLTITNNLITREQLNTPAISIYFNDIKTIGKHKNGSFIVKGRDTLDQIAIPAQIDNYLELEILLQQIKPINVNDEVPFFERYRSVTAIITVGLMLCVYTVNNKLVVALTGSALVILMVWSFIKTRNSKNIDNKSKTGIWWVFIVLASVIAVMFIKLTGRIDL